MGLVTITHLACALAFLTLALLITFGKPSNTVAWLALVASCLTALWALIAGLVTSEFIQAVPLAETVRSLAWLAFGGALLTRAAGGLRGIGKFWLSVGLAVAILVLALDLARFASDIKGIPVTANEVWAISLWPSPESFCSRTFIEIAPPIPMERRADMHRAGRNFCLRFGCLLRCFPVAKPGRSLFCRRVRSPTRLRFLLSPSR